MGCRGYFSAHPWDVRQSEAIRLLNLLAQRYFRGVLMNTSGRPVAVLALRDGLSSVARQLARLGNTYQRYNVDAEQEVGFDRGVSFAGAPALLCRRS